MENGRTLLKRALVLAAALLPGMHTFAQADKQRLPQIVHQNGHYQLQVDGKPFFILGGQAHNSSGWPGMMPQVWLALEKMHANTLEVPLYWEQIEPSPGKFDFSIIDVLLTEARQQNKRLVLLWFGADPAVVRAELILR